YANRDRVLHEAESVLLQFSGLAPKTDTYTHEDGRTVVLLCLHGTIAITYRAVTYNIPVAIWVPFTYPQHPPICHVTPTATMLIRASKHVDLSGKIYHPYLAYWHMRSEVGRVWRKGGWVDVYVVVG
ncbi:UEV domain-containing protein, partial [Blyttiomyces helicus]